MISYTVDSYKDGMISTCAFGGDLESARRWANDCIENGARRVVITRSDLAYNSTTGHWRTRKKTMIVDIKAA